jgi:hypothetical protein
LGIGPSGVLPDIGSGWIFGPDVQFPYTSGNVTFTIQLFQGSSYAAAASTPDSGLGYGSVTWIEPASAIAINIAPPGDFTAFPLSYNAGQGITVALSVPEPTTMVIVGLGAAVLIVLRRREV